MSPDVELVVQTLVDMGVISEDGCKKLANIFRTLKQLANSADVYRQEQGQRGFYVKQDIRNPVAAGESPAGEAQKRDDESASCQVDTPQRHDEALQPERETVPLAGDALQSATPPSRDRLQRILELGESPRIHEPTSTEGSPDHEFSQEPQGDALDGFEEQAIPTRKRAPRGSFNPSKEELAQLRETLTIKQIAEQHQVSMGTVCSRLREMGLTIPGRRGRPVGKS